MKPSEKKTNSLQIVFSIRDFRLLFVGTIISLLGDQFALIAMPWLVLRLTGDPLALGIVLALEGLPRAALLLVGGAVTDRVSPRSILLVSDIIRFGLTVFLAVVVFTGTAEVWMLYLFGFCFGLVAGFSEPAGNSIVPILVGKDHLRAGNAIMMGFSQLIGFLGPSLAGILIGTYASSNIGVGVAFAVDSASFFVSAAALLGMQNRKPAAREESQKETILQSILAGLRYIWADKPLRLMFLVVTAVNFFFIGPILLGVPVLADGYLREGAVAFGLLMSGLSFGNLSGYLLAGILPRPSSKLMSALLIGLMGVFGVGTMMLGFLHITWLDFAVMFAMGLGNGYITIMVFTWMQTRTPEALLGRIMSILMLSNLGLVPLSQAISGAVIKWSMPALFSSAGLLILAVGVWMAIQPELKVFSKNLADDHAQQGREASIAPESSSG